jgi:chemosensory pili system protein ChpA (sensor histidine kinase/response regulator)
MMQTSPNAAPDIDPESQDLGPLAWIRDEVRKSLDAAGKSFKRYARESEAARAGNGPEPDAGQLRLARQQLHQAAGALLMVGQVEASRLVAAMESAGERLLLQPELCTEEAASRIEHGGFAMAEFLDGVVSGKSVTPVALFPQYREAQEIAGADRVHPADLWPQPWHWQQPQVPAGGESLGYDAAVRGRLDPLVLRVVKTGDAAAARELHDLCLGLSQSQGATRAGAFWMLAAAYFEAVALGLLPQDLYTKRAGSRILLQYTTLAKGDPSVSERLAQDLLFFCAQAVPAAGQIAPTLSAVREAWRLPTRPAVNYLRPQYGLFDPAVLALARKRIEAAKELWSGLSGGDAGKLRNLTDAFGVVTESLLKIYPPSAPMAQALSRAIDTTARSGKPPPAELAMEVATSVLYLEAAFEDLDPADPQLEIRATQLAERLEGVRMGGQPRPLEHWMEDLYRRVSDRQTMGTVVGELRTHLGELEKAMDSFFRNPADKSMLRSVPGELSQMRGVLSVLGLDHATQAVLRMRDSVEEILITEVDEARARAAGTFEKLGNNLGALGFLIDMLNYQPALAKKLFVYDADAGELKPLMGRQTEAAVSQAPAPVTLDQQVQTVVQAAVQEVSAGQLPDNDITQRLQTLASQAELADQSDLARSVQQATQALAVPDAKQASEALSHLAAAVTAPPPPAPVVSTQSDIDEDDLQDIFLEEAREVVQTGLAALQALAQSPEDLNQQTTLRRAFHTLKGSSRMVGLTEFGEAAWSMEQVLNAWLAEQKPVTADLLGLSTDAMNAFGEWVEDIAAGAAQGWRADTFRAAGDAMRMDSQRVPIATPAHGVIDSEIPADAASPVDVAPAAPQFEPQLEADSAEITAMSFDVIEQAAPAGDFSFDATAFSPPPFDLPPVSDFSETRPPELPAQDPMPAQVPESVQADVDVDALFGEDVPLDDGSVPVDDATVVVLEDFEPTRWPEEAAAQTPATVVENAPVFADSYPPTDFRHTETPAEPAVDPQSALSPDAAPLDIQGIDFASLAAVSDVAGAQAAESGDAAPAAPVSAPAEESFDEQTKVIGSLRISIPLYNVYLNEADEWSRRLVTEVTEWSMELPRPVSDSTVALAHSLAGSSATVGFQALSALARLFEAALQHVQLQSSGTQQQAEVFTEAAEEIRRLLHQFAAGFLKEPSEPLLEALREVCATPVDMRGPETEMPPLDEDIYEIHDTQAPPVLEPIEPVPHAEASDSFFGTVEEPLAGKQPEPALVEPGYVAPAAVFAAPSETQDEDDDVIDAVDAVDADLFPIFEEEAIELLPRLAGALRQWAERPDNMGARVETLRNLHTLKGSARLAGALRLGEMTHNMESRIEQFGSQEVPPAAWIEALQGRFDVMQQTFEALRMADTQAQEAQAIEAAQPHAPVMDAEPVPDGAAPAPSSVPPGVSAVTAPTPVRAVVPASTSSLAPLRASSQQAVRVRSQLLDRLVNQAGEVIITRSRLESELGQLRSSLGDLTGNLDRLRQQLRDIEVQAESQMQSRLAQAKDSQQGFDPLEFDRFTRVQELTRMMAESVNDVATVQRTLQRTVQATEDDLNAQARQTRELQRDLLRTRMVEFEGISERLYRVVRQASKDAGKQVKLDITGGSIEMDRGVLDRMTPAFEHLLRNCVAHGVELPDDRTAAGKDASGTIVVDVRQEGNDVSVEFRDDGAGLNLPRIREKAIAQGLISPDQELSEQEAASLIFMPGFSTATQVSELAGRGIGMDVVRSEVNALGGRIETSTRTGQGSSFRLVLPLTTAVTQVVMLRMGNQSIGVPSNLVELVRRAPSRELEQAYNSSTYPFGGEDVPFFWSGALLQASARSTDPTAKTSQVVVFRSAQQRVALHVDEVLGNQEVVVKNLGPQLARLPGLAGMTVLSTGAVVLIYNPVALAAVYGALARSMSADYAQPEMLAQVAAAAGGEAVVPAVSAPPQVPLVLVVDDSITVRRVTQRLLQREGYRVSLAADGLQALERLQEEKPMVVLSDIEMPRMDGFDLARNIRNDERLRELPIIMITSRIAEKHREHAMQLGVNHYLGKPYSEEELLSLVRRYALGTVEA